MVASENKREKLIRNVEEELSSSGYRVSRKTIKEKNLLGEENRYELIHAVSIDEKTIITIRLRGIEDKHRIHITTTASSNIEAERKADKLESIGLRVHEEESTVTASGTVSSKNLLRRIREMIDSVR